MEALGKLEDLCRVQPEIPDILGRLFNEYEFVFSGENMSSSEVFDYRGFLPLFSILAAARVNELLDLSLDADLQQSQETLLGFEATPKLNTPSSLLVYLSGVAHLAYDIFGIKPTSIQLDVLYEWATNADSTEWQSLPYLGHRE